MARATSNRPQKRKQCDICHRDFARTEHLQRHRRTHTTEKPFECPFCQQLFPREDVRTGHIKKSHPSILAHTSLENVIGTRSVRARACEQCRSRKIKCAGSVPCDACRTSNRTCTLSLPSSNSALDNSHITSQTDSRPAASQSVPSHQTSGSGDVAHQIMDLEILTGSEPFQLPTNEVSLQIPNDVDIIPLDPLNWNIFDTGYNNWNGNLDYFTVPSGMHAETFLRTDAYPSIDWETLLANEILDDLDQSATSMVRDYLDRRQSRRSSPSAQLREQTWYSSPPQLQIYDDEVIDALLKIFQSQFSETFPVFANIENSATPTTEMCLAMAAIGALFCDIWGSFKVAKALYNDARRMLLGYKVYQPPSLCDNLTIVKCFILLEIYGLCCGEQRAFEFIEAFHQELLQAYHNYCASTTFSSPSSAEKTERQHLIESIYTLECYRVTILQRPPNIYPPRNVDGSSSVLGQWSSDSDLTKLASALCTPGRRFEDHLVRRYSLPTLSIISLYTWAVTPRSNRAASSGSLWKIDFVELALNNWVQAQDSTTDWLTTVLYHMINANLHVNLGILQRCVHAHVLTKHDTLVTVELEGLAKSEGFEIALWHARSLLQRVQEQQARCRETNHTNARTPLFNLRNSNQNVRSADKGPALREAPHLPYAIYFASLLEWTAGIGHENSATTCAAAIELGIRLLSDLRIQVAEVLTKLLQELRK